MKARGLLLTLVIVACVGATSAQATGRHPFDGTYLLNQRHTPGYLKVDCPATASSKAVHLKNSVPVPAITIHVLNNMLEGHLLSVGVISASVSWSKRIPVSGGSQLVSTSFHFTDIGHVPDVTELVTTAGHYTVGGVTCTVSGSTGQWGKRTGE